MSILKQGVTRLVSFLYLAFIDNLIVENILSMGIKFPPTIFPSDASSVFGGQQGTLKNPLTCRKE